MHRDSLFNDTVFGLENIASNYGMSVEADGSFVLVILKDKIIYVKHNYLLLLCADTCFTPFSRSSLGLVTLQVRKCHVHIGIPVCLH